MQHKLDEPSSAAVRRIRRKMRFAAVCEISLNALALAALAAFAALILVATPDSVNGDGEVADEGPTFIGHMSESEVAE